MSTESPDWTAVIRRIDTLSAAATLRDQESRRISMEEVAIGFSELAKLRHGSEPDYATCGLGTAYLLYYLAKRAVNAAIACSTLRDLPASVRVLDLGSGTNAAALALSVMFPWTHFVIAAVEPSEEMAAAGDAAVVDLPNVALRKVRATLEEVLDQDALAGESFDLVIMSAMLPYEWSKNSLAERVEFGERLWNRTSAGGRMLVIEPAAKAWELNEFEKCMVRVGMREVRVTGADVLGLDLFDRPLPCCTAVFEEWYPEFSASGVLSEWAEETLRGADVFGLGLGGRYPDLVLSCSRTIGPRPRESAYRPLQIAPAVPVVLAPIQPRVRVKTSLSMRERLLWGVGAMAVVAAIAVGVFALV